MKKCLLSILLLVIIFACGDAEQMLTSLIPETSEVPDGMVLIPAGEVLLGAPPQETVYLDDFLIDTHEVTIEEFQDFVEVTGYNEGYHWFLESTPQHPVFASYYAAQAYAEWAGKRLPTDTEWEKAARGGLVGKRYSWGDEIPTSDHAHITFNSVPRAAIPHTIPVGSYPPNGYGLYDIAGNVAEWVQTDPDTEYAPTRGGSWLSTEWYTRVHIRENLLKVGHFGVTGFRCVKDTN